MWEREERASAFEDMTVTAGKPRQGLSKPATLKSCLGGRGVRVCHFHGTPFSYNAAISFLENQALIRFHTSLYAPAGVRNRSHPDLPKKCVRVHPGWETLRLAATRLPWRRVNGHQQWFVDFVAVKFDEDTAKSVQHTDGAVYCYEDSAALTFARARQLGVRRIYELPIMHYREMRRVFQTEVDRYPELRRHFQSFHEPQWKLDQKDLELEAADVIVVPATFVGQSITRFLPVKVPMVVAPYGADTSVPAKKWTDEDQKGPLRLLFAGILGPRKGLHILFDALDRIPASAYDLTLAGRWEPGFREWLTGKHPGVSFRWAGSLSATDLHMEYRKAHLMVFPSLAEGFGLVILEAMASGIPVISTERTAAFDIITDQFDGFMVPAGNSWRLQASIEYALDHRVELAEMGGAARRKAERLSWQRYRETLQSGLANAFAN
jgi:alpha-maltose-1-phosphate synthase